ncbi:carboxymuconolactone decarboxylase family protein [Flavobacterium litorale]|uniref:Carboxymuconolactone decarboxylase family protein n=1 Tax=Flavobacterium litorale TaxID=2856519 RepID=A0ABX8V708_9FLAO|nr:carboxymuconolactone decarboxylase family protein [Flavobacterium litorale]QYJ68617.1 carboxymuconolactone decarboxylase family protein [Flavobacterium litorale]
MDKRLKLNQAAPKMWDAMYNFSNALDETKVTPVHKELIKIRASQINGCSFCMDMHAHDARKIGETEQRIYVLSAWRETTFFTEEERAILALTEAVTTIGENHVPDAVYKNAISLLGEGYIAEVLMCIVVINCWNRIAITTGMMPE